MIPPFERARINKIAERKMYFEEERERLYEALCREFYDDEQILKRIERLFRTYGLV